MSLHPLIGPRIVLMGGMVMFRRVRGGELEMRRTTDVFELKAETGTLYPQQVGTKKTDTV